MTVYIRYLGHAAFEITDQKGVKMLIDPWISGNPSCPIKVEDIEKADLILVSHMAFDHGKDDAIKIAKKTGAVLFCGHDMQIYAIKNGVPSDKIKTLVWGQIKEYLGIKIKGMEARHGSFLRLDGDYRSWLAQGFMIWVEPEIRMFYAGDTSLFSDLQLIGQIYRPNIAFIPVGAAPGAAPELYYNEAILATVWLSPDVAIPMHYVLGSQEAEMWSKCLEILAPHIRTCILKPGEILKFDKKITCEKVERIPNDLH